MVREQLKACKVLETGTIIWGGNWSSEALFSQAMAAAAMFWAFAEPVLRKYSSFARKCGLICSQAHPMPFFAASAPFFCIQS